MACGFHFGALNLDLIPFHWEIMSFGCHSWEFWLQMMAVVAVAPRKAGRQLPPWRELEVVQLENLSLRHRALQWLTSTGRQCHPLTSSSDRGRKTYLGRCSYHSQCPKRFRFALLGDDRMMVSELNEHGDKVDLQVPCSIFWLRSIWMTQICSIVVKGLGPADCDFSLCLPFEVARRENARKYAKVDSASRALNRMERGAPAKRGAQCWQVGPANGRLGFEESSSGSIWRLPIWGNLLFCRVAHESNGLAPCSSWIPQASWSIVCWPLGRQVSRPVSGLLPIHEGWRFVGRRHDLPCLLTPFAPANWYHHWLRWRRKLCGKHDATRYHQQRNLGTQSHHQFDDGQALRRYGAGLTACLLTEKNPWLLRGRCRSVERPMVSQGHTLEENHEEDREQPESWTEHRGSKPI